MTLSQAKRRSPSGLLPGLLPGLLLGLGLACACSAPVPRQLSGEEEQALRRYEERAAELRRIPLPLGANDRLILRGLDGDVRVVASRSDPELLARLGTRALEPHEARAMLHRLEFVVEREGKTVIVQLVRPDLEELVLTDSSYEVAVPAGAAVVVEAQPGNVTVEGPFRACDASSRFGSVQVRDIQGDVRIANGAGDVRVEGARSKLIDVSTAHGQVEVRRSQAATVQVHSASGKVSIWNVEADTLAVSSDHGAVNLQGVRGNVSASCGSGPLSLVDGVGERFELSALQGTLRVEGASGTLQLSAPAGDIHVSSASGRLEARSTFGSIDATGLFEHVHVVTTSGTVEVEALPGSAPAGAWHLESSYADVELRLPADAAFELHARTVYGEVEPEFPLLIEAGRSSGENTLRGRLNGGGPLLELSSVTGDLRLRRRVR